MGKGKGRYRTCCNAFFLQNYSNCAQPPFWTSISKRDLKCRLWRSRRSRVWYWKCWKVDCEILNPVNATPKHGKLEHLPLGSFLQGVVSSCCIPKCQYPIKSLRNFFFPELWNQDLWEWAHHSPLCCYWHEITHWWCSLWQTSQHLLAL